jgi:hypothetical protein
VTRCGGVVMLVGGEEASGREKGADNVSWANVNLTELKNDENPRGQFNWYK